MGKITSMAKKLESGFDVKDREGNIVKFTSALASKYLQGIGRKSGIDVERLKQLPRAILAVHKANGGVVLHPKDNPPEKSYFHRFSDKRGIIVFTDAKTGAVRGFIYGKTRKLLEKHKRT